MHIGNVPGMTHHGALLNYYTWLNQPFHFDHIMIYHAYMWLTKEGGKSDIFDAKKILAITKWDIPS